MITLTEAKSFVRIDHAEDDPMIEGMIAAAIEHLTSVGVNTEIDPLPAPLKQAALILVAHFYDTRDLVEGADVKPSTFFMRLIAPYREVAL